PRAAATTFGEVSSEEAPADWASTRPRLSYTTTAPPSLATARRSATSCLASFLTASARETDARTSLARAWECDPSVKPSEKMAIAAPAASAAAMAQRNALDLVKWAKTGGGVQSR